MQAFRVEGEWWLPENGRATKLPGVLTFDPASHAQLTICTVDYRTWNAESSLTDGRIPIVIGETHENDEFTLLNCLPHYTVDERCGPYFRYTIGLRSDVAIKGRLFETPDDILFEEVKTCYTFMLSWLVAPSMNDDEAWEKELLDCSEGSSSYILFYHDVFESFVVECDDASFHFVSENSPEIELDERVITTHKHVVVRLSADKSIIRYIEYINIYLRNFLTLAVARPVYPLFMYGSLPGEAHGRGVEIFTAILGYDTTSPDRAHEHMLFRYRDVTSDFGNYLSKWLTDYEICRASHDVYFDSFFNSRSAPTTTFLLLTQALEGYHRELYNGKLIDEGEYRCLRNALEAVTDTLISDQSFKDIFRSTMDRGNDYTFRRRLARITDTLIKEHFDDIFGGDPEVDNATFVNKIVITRNYYTHRSQDDSGVIPKARIPDYTIKLDIIIKTFLLVRLGLSSSLIERLLVPFVNQYWIAPHRD